MQEEMLEGLEGLSLGTRGKGVLMFAQRRRRRQFFQKLDQIVPKELSELPEPEEDWYHVQSPTPLQTDESGKILSQEDYAPTPPVATDWIPGHGPRALVPNRTAKPFGSINSGTMLSVTAIVPSSVKKREPRFKVPVPVAVSRAGSQVWTPPPPFPTPFPPLILTSRGGRGGGGGGDHHHEDDKEEFIASRDQRISVPAKQTAVLPESKKKKNRLLPMGKQVSGSSDHWLDRCGWEVGGDGRRSDTEPEPEEEDFFSLGAEACNFMHPSSAAATRLKIPPPVAPKPRVPNPNPDPDRQQCIPPSEFSRLPPGSLGDRSPAVGPECPERIGSPGCNWLQTPGKSRSQSLVGIEAAGPTAPRGGGEGPSPGIGHSGAALFASRLCWMERFVANSTETVVPGGELSGSLSYKPILSPSYPLPSSGPRVRAETQGKTRDESHREQLCSLDMIKHRPYQLDPSLFVPEMTMPQNHSPGPSLSPVTPAPGTLARKTRSQVWSSQSPAVRSWESDAAPGQGQTGPSPEFPPPPPAQPRLEESFSPATLLMARGGARQMAPKPSFCAKKLATAGSKQRWRPVVLQRL